MIINELYVSILVDELLDDIMLKESASSSSLLVLKKLSHKAKELLKRGDKEGAKKILAKKQELIHKLRGNIHSSTYAKVPAYVPA